jgi:transporter family protein
MSRRWRVAALTAIFAKVGVENVNSDFATFIRTVVILCALGALDADLPRRNPHGPRQTIG